MGCASCARDVGGGTRMLGIAPDRHNADQRLQSTRTRFVELNVAGVQKLIEFR